MREIVLAAGKEGAAQIFRNTNTEAYITAVSKCEEHPYSLNGRYSRYFTTK